MPGLTFSSKYIGFQDYQPDPEDLCSLCGGNFGKAAMIEGKDKIHICMECIDLLGVMKKERDDKKRNEAAKGLIDYLDKETDIDNVFSINDVISFYDAIAAGKIPHIRID
ncbi:hypothetical protein ABQ297_21495 [Enterobacter hormaechei]|uniref:hypothetical protein n=1 Tax=Enterobacter hormaechei TaxID=158836 RepID=UPI000DBF04F2|nr:hypothetical protein [Enterobacter hormaechei]MCU3463856.1 hypothetical protein [Enterobacter hormaechei subsp. xiangfangensis]AWX01108.1 hypothetical protein DPF84_04790 [Enterobacter hormaechei]MCL8147009.1 hypothetical protein [Enterobacter hormaechei]MCM7929041.1 hypothetical protein [Enterobacter hormaechei]MCM7948702.1 hypothetical protein [Enterobacter hormaechei]